MLCDVREEAKLNEKVLRRKEAEAFIATYGADFRERDLDARGGFFYDLYRDEIDEAASEKMVALRVVSNESERGLVRGGVGDTGLTERGAEVGSRDDGGVDYIAPLPSTREEEKIHYLTKEEARKVSLAYQAEKERLKMRNPYRVAESDYVDTMNDGYYDIDEYEYEQPQSVANVKSMLSKIGYYQGEINDVRDDDFDKAISEYSNDNEIFENEVSRLEESIVQILKDIKTPTRLDFDGKRLIWLEDGKPVFMMKAQSGTNEHQKKRYQNKRNEGPIPEGKYYVKQDKVQNVKNSFLERLGYGEAPNGYRSWGSKRLELIPFKSNEMYGRKGFFLHGGKSFGSAGCIDLGPYDLRFFDKFQKYGQDLILNVHYDE